MKIKVSDYIVKKLIEHKINTSFSVVGGGAMHLNDAFGHNKNMTCYYNHHEQACAMAAESYARITNRIAALCVTTGPGGTNAITGVVGGWMDSIPMLIISGQVRYDTTAMSTNLNIRAMGDQEFNIVECVKNMTKYAQLVVDPKKIRYCLEKAIYEATNGRPGPCWLDIPLNVQASMIEEDDLEGFDPTEFNKTLPPKVSKEIVKEIIDRIKEAKRPVFNVGNGIRIAKAFEVFKEVVEKLNIPVVTGWDSIDAIYDEHPLYVGRAGIMGDRPGNWAIQNSDLILSIGSRLSIRQVGYNYATWARYAYTIVNDIDSEELKKPTVHISMPVWADALDLLKMINEELKTALEPKIEWNNICASWKKKYPVVQNHHYENTEKANVYAFINELGKRSKENSIIVVGNGSACVVGSHAFPIKKNQRFIVNSGIASMGYDLPAAIGACVGGDFKDVICISGDGSIQMNIQELQTIIHHKMPIKIFVINNNGYHSIRQTQKNFFGEPLVGVGLDSGDLSFPDLEKIAYAYGYPFTRIYNNLQFNLLDEFLKIKGPAICEIMVSIDQKFEPKAASKKLADGTMYSAPLEDLAPFLPREELNSIMIVKETDK